MLILSNNRKNNEQKLPQLNSFEKKNLPNDINNKKNVNFKKEEKAEATLSKKTFEEIEKELSKYASDEKLSEVLVYCHFEKENIDSVAYIDIYSLTGEENLIFIYTDKFW